MVKKFEVGKIYMDVEISIAELMDPNFIVIKIIREHIYVKYLNPHRYKESENIDHKGLVMWDIDFIEKYVEIKKETNDKN